MVSLNISVVIWFLSVSRAIYRGWDVEEWKKDIIRNNENKIGGAG
jgi:hypothetical protein